MTTIKDSGTRQTFDTGSVRDCPEGKGRYDLLPTRALARVARHFEGGSKKYGDRNWEKGQPLARFLDSALRHAFSFLEGRRDEDHAAAAAWNLLCLIETQERIQEGVLPASLDNLPKGSENNLSEGFDASRWCEVCGRLKSLMEKGRYECMTCPAERLGNFPKDKVARGKTTSTAQELLTLQRAKLLTCEHCGRVKLESAPEVYNCLNCHPERFGK